VLHWMQVLMYKKFIGESKWLVNLKEIDNVEKEKKPY
jgi:hypothetical protein